jgi:hypothetical protein
MRGIRHWRELYISFDLPCPVSRRRRREIVSDANAPISDMGRIGG